MVMTRPNITLGNRYYRGAGVKEDKAEALKWYQKSAEQDDAEAQLMVGLMNYKGEGTARNLQKRLRGIRRPPIRDWHRHNMPSATCNDKGEGFDKKGLRLLNVLTCSKEGTCLQPRMPCGR